MHRTRFAAGLTAAAAGLILAACSDSSDTSPTSPMVASPATASVISCNNQAFNNARGFARTYFVNPTQLTAVDLIDDMEAASSGPTRTAIGLDVVVLVAAGNDVKAGEDAAGSNLLNFVVGCSNLGLADPIDWTGALGPQGALAVVSSTSDPVYSDDKFSAVAPPATKTWSQWLRLPSPPDFPDSRAIVFGAPFPVTFNLSPENEVGTRGFDWNVLPPRSFPFGTEATDFGFVGLCVTSSTTERVQNNHSGVPGLLGVPATDPLALLTCEDFDGDGQPLASTGLFRRMMDLLSPQPAYAAALVAAKSTGTPRGFSQHFVVKPIALKVTVGTIGDAFVGADLNGNAGVKVTVTTIPPIPPGSPPGTPPPTGVPLQSAQVRITIAGNNGVPANFTPQTGSTNESGEVVFKGLKLFSAGGYVATATVTGGGLTQDPVTGRSNQFHIKNKK